MPDNLPNGAFRRLERDAHRDPYMSSPPDGPVVNDPQTLAELQSVFDAYEAALLRNDIAALNEFFWSDPRILRYGIAEHSLGHAAICEYRSHAQPVNPARQLQRPLLMTFGFSTGSACTEFVAPGTRGVGRQTQTWIRFTEGWRIVAAHVSQLQTPIDTASGDARGPA
jgi:hypothetical protein